MENNGAKEVMGVNLAMIGSAAASLLDDKTKKMLQTVNPEEWYPADRIVDIITQINAKGPKMARVVGRSNMYAVKHLWANFGVERPDQALSALNDVYHAQNRGSGIGDWGAEDVTENSALISDTTLYDCGFNEGIVEGVVSSLGGRIVKLDHVECRKSGADACKYHVEWKMK